MGDADHALILEIGIDMLVNADAARAPFAELIGHDRQGFERRRIDRLQQFPEHRPEPANMALFVELGQRFADRRIHFRKVV